METNKNLTCRINSRRVTVTLDGKILNRQYTHLLRPMKKSYLHVQAKQKCKARSQLQRRRKR